MNKKKKGANNKAKAQKTRSRFRSIGGAGGSILTLARGRTVEVSFQKRFGQKLKECKKLGEGKYGEVFEYLDPFDDTLKALKIIRKSKLKDWSEKAFMKSEVEIHRELDHPHIVKLYQYYEEPKAHFMLLEYMQGGELFDRIVRDTSFSERKAALITRNVAEALLYLHERNIVHRDLKPENLLLASKDDDVNLKLADFGFAANCSTDLSAPVGTLTYIAPEILQGKKYRQEIDIWSLGIITYTMLCGYPPFDGDNEKDQMRRIVKGRLGFVGSGWDKISEDAKDLLKKMLTRDQKARIPVKEVLDHPWLKNAEERSNESLNEIAENMRNFRAKQLLKKALAGVKAIERMRKLAEEWEFVYSDEEDEEEK